MKTIQKDVPLDIHWHSFELRPAGSPPMPESYRERVLAARPQFAAVMKEEFDIDIKYGKWGINSRPSLIGAKYAEAQGKAIGDAYHWGVLHAYWQEGVNIGDLDALADIAEAAGMEREPFLASLENAAYEVQVDADIEQAHAFGIGSVPTLIFIDKFMVVGAHPTPTLRQAIDQIMNGEVN